MTDSGRAPAVAAAALTGVQVGAAVVASRAAVPDLGPTTLALLRYAIGTAMLVPLALSLGRPRFAARDVAPISVLGIGQFGVLVALLNLSLEHLSSGLVALIFATLPVQTMVVAAALGRERVTLRRCVGTVLATAGVGAALGESALAPVAGDWWVGAVAAFASAFTGALCSVLYRPYLARYPTVHVSALAMTASVAFLALASLADPPPIGWADLGSAPWAIVAFVGVSSGVGYILWLYALRELPATDVTMYLALSPLTAALLGALLLDEHVGIGLVAGLALVVVGMRLTTTRTRRPAAGRDSGPGSAAADQPPPAARSTPSRITFSVREWNSRR